MAIHGNNSIADQLASSLGAASANAAPAAAPTSASAGFTAPEAQNLTPNAGSLHGKTSINKSWVGLGSGLFNVSMSPADEVLGNTHLAFSEFVETNNKLNETGMFFNIIPMNRSETPGLPLSILVFTARDITNGEQPQSTSPLTYFTLLLDKSIPKPAPTRTNTNYGMIDLVKTYGQMYTEAVGDIVKNRVRQMFPNVDEKNIHFAGVAEAGLLFDQTNKDNVKALLNMIKMACARKLMLLNPKWEELNLSVPTLTNPQLEYLQTELVFNQPQALAPDNYPIRQDVGVKLIGHTRARNNNSGNAIERNHDMDSRDDISMFGGFLDLMYVGPRTDVGHVANPFHATQVYQAAFIITNPMMYRPQTMPAFLLALSSVVSLVRDNNFWLGLKPDYTYGQPLHDIGVLGYDMEGGARIDTTPANFSNVDLGQLAQIKLREGLSIGMDISTVGTNNWLLSVFGAAAMHGVGSSAERAIIAAANQLTNGKFSEKVAPNTPVMLGNSTIMWEGYYTDGSGNHRDGRDIDTLLIMGETTEKDPNLLRAWIESFHASKDPTAAAYERLRIIQTLRPSFQPTGQALRSMINPVFMQGLIEAIQACGLTISTGNVGANMLGQQAVMSLGLNSAVTATAATASVFSAHGVYGHPTNSNNQLMAQWGRRG